MDTNPYGTRAVVPLEVPKIHPVRVLGCHTMTNYELGRRIVGMRYDQVAEVLRGMLHGLRDEIDGDMKRGRTQLVGHLSNAYIYLRLALVYIEKVFLICRPFMRHELDREKNSIVMSSSIEEEKK